MLTIEIKNKNMPANATPLNISGIPHFIYNQYLDAFDALVMRFGVIEAIQRLKDSGAIRQSQNMCSARA